MKERKVKSLSCIQLFATPWTVCRLPGFSAHGIFQARILEWVAISFSSQVIFKIVVRFVFRRVNVRWSLSSRGLGRGRLGVGGGKHDAACAVADALRSPFAASWTCSSVCAPSALPDGRRALCKRIVSCVVRMQELQPHSCRPLISPRLALQEGGSERSKISRSTAGNWPGRSQVLSVWPKSLFLFY